MDIGARIRQLRMECGLSQKDLAQKLNLSNRTVSSWEKNRTEPHMELIEDMCKIFGCSKTYFYSDYNYDYDIKGSVDYVVVRTKDSNGNEAPFFVEQENKDLKSTMQRLESLQLLLNYASKCTDEQLESVLALLKHFIDSNQKEDQ